MSVGIIIFSRLGSNRLPGKALIDIFGRPLLGRVIDRAKLIEGGDHIIVATSSCSDDDEIVSFAIQEGVDTFRGSLNNVAERALDTCNFFGLEKFARICGDRPFFDPCLISSLIEIHNGSDLDIVTTNFPRTYPPGLTGEIVSTKALRKAVPLMIKEQDKEHLTTYFYSHPSDFLIKNIEAPSNLDFSGLNLCVDNKKDLERAKWIASNIAKTENNYASMSDIFSLAKAWNEEN